MTTSIKVMLNLDVIQKPQLIFNSDDKDCSLLHIAANSSNRVHLSAQNIARM
jgi:hypothetical protein